jgi:hypothetical protein
MQPPHIRTYPGATRAMLARRRRKIAAELAAKPYVASAVQSMLG